MTDLRDLARNAVGGVSILPGTTNDQSGGYVDMGDSDGPIHALCQNGAATGSPTSYSLAWKIQEADDTNGTGLQDIPGAAATIANAAPGTNNGKPVRITTAVRSKRYVRVVADVTLVGGSGPTVPVAASVIGQRRSLTTAVIGT